VRAVNHILAVDRAIVKLFVDGIVRIPEGFHLVLEVFWGGGLLIAAVLRGAAT
jgi:hypothetical protein